MYDVYLDKILLPVAPSKIQLKIKNQNKIVTMINEGEINILKQAGLSDISFQALIPQMQYPFARYKNGFQGASFFLNAFEKLKIDLNPFQFIVSRTTPNGKLLFDTNIKVSMEDYAVNEDAQSGFDLILDVKLKQYKPYATKTVQITFQQAKPQAAIQQARPAGNQPQTRTYTVANGDTLWGIAKKYYNNGNDYPKIFNANKDKISNPNLIYPGQVLSIP